PPPGTTGIVFSYCCMMIGINRSRAPTAVNFKISASPFKSDAARLVVYAPLETPVGEFAQAAKAPPSKDRVQETVKPGAGFPFPLYITKGNVAKAVFFRSVIPRTELGASRSLPV